MASIDEDDTIESNDPLLVSFVPYHDHIKSEKSSIPLTQLAGIHLLMVNSKLRLHLDTRGAPSIIQTAYVVLPQLHYCLRDTSPW